MIPVQKSFGDRLKLMREVKCLSQEQLAQRVSSSRVYICELECGKANPSIQILSQIANGLGMTLSELLDGVT